MKEVPELIALTEYAPVETAPVSDELAHMIRVIGYMTPAQAKEFIEQTFYEQRATTTDTTL